MHRAARETEKQTHKLLPLHEAPTGRNNQSMRVNKPFSYQEIQKIKEDLGDYLEDPEKYIGAFKDVTLLYDLTWKDVMYILGQMLTPNSKSQVLGRAAAYGDEWFGNESVGKREDELTALSTGNQVVPTTELGWDYNTAKRRWDQSHFVRCILEGLRQACSKPFSSVQFSSVTQSCSTLCDPMNCSTPGLPVHHQLLEFTQTHVHRVGDAIQSSHPLSSPSSPALTPASRSFPVSQLFT